jgi:hypothetical protein
MRSLKSALGDVCEQKSSQWKAYESILEAAKFRLDILTSNVWLTND